MAKEMLGPDGYSVPEEIKQLKEDVFNLKKEITNLKTEEKVELQFKTLTPTAKIPTQAHKGDLWDIYADENVLIIEDESKLVSTGIAFNIPKGYQVRIYNRSSNPLKNKIILSNGTGVIDEGYKDEIKGQFFCIHGCHQIHKGDKIMQMELVKIVDFEFKQVKELDKTNDRGGGFGSTDK